MYVSYRHSIAALALILATGTCGWAPARAAAMRPHMIAHADSVLLDTITVPDASSFETVTGTVSLDSSTVYTLVVSGTASKTGKGSWDALYCLAGNTQEANVQCPSY